MIRILAVDDEEPFRRLLKKELTRKGFQVDVAPDGEQLMAALRGKSYDIILLDIVMPGMDGITLTKQLKEDPSCPTIILLTGKATVETAVEAMKNGAYDYLTKPYKLDELVIVINRAYEYRKMSAKTQMLQQELVRKEAPDSVVHRSRQMADILALIKKIAPTDSSVFIQGESGTGKELIANTIWQQSRRNSSPLIALNCATLPDTLIESELFGYEKGAHSTAFQLKYGIVEVADKGTLFLDEIGEIPLGLQAKLLRFLDSGEFRRLGGNKPLKADVRVITATNRDLAVSVKNGSFRPDLYYRLNVINVIIPPLRDRKEDVEALALHFAEKYSHKLSKPFTGFDAQALEMLSAYSWPGNVRELENVVERAVILCDTDTIGPSSLSLPRVEPVDSDASLSSLEEIEREHIIKVLRETGGNQSRASQILGIDRKTLYLKLKKYGLDDGSAPLAQPGVKKER